MKEKIRLPSKKFIALKKAGLKEKIRLPSKKFITLKKAGFMLFYYQEVALKKLFPKSFLGRSHQRELKLKRRKSFYKAAISKLTD